MNFLCPSCRTPLPVAAENQSVGCSKCGVVVDLTGVVRILDEGEDRGFCWYAMEKIDGPDLRRALKNTKMSAAEVEALSRALLAALAAVHDAGLVHRDIKPGNILLSDQGPKLCDFGIARFDGQATLTESAAILESLRYMAPEQRWGKSSLLSDLYCVGVVLHEALCGGVPGEATLDAGTPQWLVDFVHKLISPRPEDRPQSARAALRWLDVRKGRLRRLLMGAGAIVATALLFFAVWATPRALPQPIEPVVRQAVTAVTEPPPIDAGVERTAATVAPPPPSGTIDAGSPIVAASATKYEVGSFGAPKGSKLKPPPKSKKKSPAKPSQ